MRKRIQKSNNCVVCTFKWQFANGVLFGNCFTSQCLHLTPNCKASGVQQSIPRLAFNVVFLMIFCIEFVMYLNTVINWQGSKSVLLLLFINVIERCYFIVCLLMNHLHRKCKIREINGLIKISEGSQLQGVEILISDGFSKIVRYLTIFAYIMIIGSTMITILEICIVLDQYTYFYMMLKMTSHGVQVLVAGALINYVCNCMLYTEMYQNVFRRMKHVLTKRIRFTRQLSISKCTSQTIDDRIVKLRDLYSALHSNMKLVMAFGDPAMLVLWAVVLVYLIDVAYILVAGEVMGEFRLRADQRIMLVKYMGSFTMVILYLLEVDKLHFVVNMS